MRKRVTIATLAAAALLAAVFYAAPFQATPAPLAGLFPAGPLLYLEAKNFAAELRAWNASEEQRRWLASASYDEFQRSALCLRLQGAWNEFSGAAAFVPDSALVQSIAGSASALAIYDIGDLQFLYVTRLPGARAMQSALWESRAKYETRHAGGVDFFVRVDSGRTVAFASTDDYLILGTREELVAGTLRLLAGEPLAPVRQDAWYADTTAAAGAPGDLRLAMNLEALLKTPQFRSHWIQRNASEIRNYRAGIADLVRNSSEIREERVFLRTNPRAALTGSAESLLQLAPVSAAFTHAWSRPSAEQVAALIEQKILAPKLLPPMSNDFAPQIYTPAAAGDESDLETRIDEPPLAAQSTLKLDDLRRLLSATPLAGMLQAQSGQLLADGVLVATPTVLAVEAERPWDSAAVRSAFTAAADSLWTTQAGAGSGWVAHQRGPRTWYSLDGLASLQLAIDGNLLLIANSEDALTGVLDRVGPRTEASTLASAAIFRHAAAAEDYRRLMTMFDHGQAAQRPAFFSRTLWSLSDVFHSVREVEVRTRDFGGAVSETVIYRR